jgi:hypothetical protein
VKSVLHLKEVKKMTKKNILLLLALAVSFLFFASHIGFAQKPATNKDIQKVKMKGKIGYMEGRGGYYVIGENPPSELFIVNQNQKTLEKLKKNGKTMTIEGRLTIGADHLMIEKINGKKYSGEKPK